VETHLNSVYRKLDLRSRVDLARQLASISGVMLSEWAIRNGASGLHSHPESQERSWCRQEGYAGRTAKMLGVELLSFRADPAMSSL